MAVVPEKYLDLVTSKKALAHLATTLMVWPYLYSKTPHPLAANTSTSSSGASDFLKENSASQNHTEDSPTQTTLTKLCVL